MIQDFILEQWINYRRYQKNITIGEGKEDANEKAEENKEISNSEAFKYFAVNFEYFAVKNLRDGAKQIHSTTEPNQTFVKLLLRIKGSSKLKLR